MKNVLDFLLAIASLMLCLLVTPVMAVVSTPVEPGSLVLVVASPTQDFEQLVQDAGGQVVGAEKRYLSVLGVSDDPQFADRLLALGAWAVLDGSIQAWLCGELNAQTK